MTNISSTKTNNKGFSLTELLVSMLAATILFLIVGTIATIANTCFNKAEREQQIFKDISYGFKFIQNRVRASSGLQIIALANPWQGRQLQINAGGEIFGVCQSGNQTNLVHRPNSMTSCDNSDIFFSASGGDAFNFVLSWPCDCTDDAATECVGDCLNACTQIGINCNCLDRTTQNPVTNSGICRNNSDFITAQVSGIKNNIQFNMETAIYSRNQ